LPKVISEWRMLSHGLLLELEVWLLAELSELLLELDSLEVLLELLLELLLLLSDEAVL